jgi:O-antigen/teichoic acid export membrane protein
VAAVATFIRTNQDSLLAFAALSAERLLQMFVGLYVVGSIARGYSREEFAAWQIAFSMFVVVGTVCDVAHERVALPKLCAADPTRVPAVWNSILLVKLAGGLASVVLMIAWAAVAGQPDVMQLALLWAAYLFLGETVGHAVLEAYARENFTWPQACRIAAMMLRLLVVIVVVEMGGGLSWLAAAWLAEIVLLNVLLCSGWIGRQRVRLSLVDWTLVRWIVGQGCALAIAAAATASLVRIERLVLAIQIPAATLSQYVASMNLLEAAFAFAGMLVTVVGAKSLFKSERIAMAHHAQLVVFAAAIAAAGAAFISLVATPLVVFVFGSIYLSSADYLRIGVWLLPLVFAQAILQAPLLARATRRFHLVKSIVALCLAIATASLVTKAGYYSLMSAGAYVGFLTLIAFDLAELRRRATEIYHGRP